MKLLLIAWSLPFLGLATADPYSCKMCTEIFHEVHYSDDCISLCQEQFSNAGLDIDEGRCDHMCCCKLEEANRNLKIEKGFNPQEKGQGAAKRNVNGTKKTDARNGMKKMEMMNALSWCEKEKFCTLMDTRFNKCPTNIEMLSKSMDDGNHVLGVHNEVFPLLSTDYIPLNEEKIQMLKRETMADSVVVPGDFQLYGYDGNIERWSVDPITDAKIEPIYPGDEGYWGELTDVVMAQFHREDGDKAEDFSGWGWPESWEDRSIADLSPWPDSQCRFGQLLLSDVAEAVNGEYPAYHQQVFVSKLLKEGVQLDLNLGQRPRSFNDFIGTSILLAAINTWVFEIVAPVNFMLKWAYGMPRPEEVAMKISRGEFTEEDGVPAGLVDLIHSMHLKDAHDFTAYKDKGCPYHPSFPAMHSAGSAASLWLAALCDLTADQYLEALRVDYAVAMGRTVAGVHYKQDNFAGLNIGQRIVREQLPNHMSQMYGYDASLVAAKLEKLSFDWKDFDSKKGTINGIPVGDFLEEAKDDIQMI